MDRHPPRWPCPVAIYILCLGGGKWINISMACISPSSGWRCRWGCRCVGSYSASGAQPGWIPATGLRGRGGERHAPDCWRWIGPYESCDRSVSCVSFPDRCFYSRRFDGRAGAGGALGLEASQVLRATTWPRRSARPCCLGREAARGRACQDARVGDAEKARVSRPQQEQGHKRSCTGLLLSVLGLSHASIIGCRDIGRLG
jgi:hypothetical protein